MTIKVHEGFFFLSLSKHFFYHIMETPKITSEDVKNVAKTIKQEMTDDEINFIIEEYPGAESEDPTGTWDLIVEDLIYRVIDERNTEFYLKHF